MRGWSRDSGMVLSSQSPAGAVRKQQQLSHNRVCIRDAFSNQKTLEYFMKTFLDSHIIALRYMVLEE